MAETAAKPALKALKCTQCGGSIELHGGHNVRSIVCQYCGACLDSKDSFKVLHQFLNQKRPFMPLKIGAKGKLKGVAFTVIGAIQYEQREDGEVFRWLEYLLFSYTHGYVYLCYENGHWVMTYEVKDIPDSEVEIVMPRKSAFSVREKTFKVFESATAQIVFVEGELTWQARQGEKIRYLDAVCPPFMYSIEQRGAEQEYFWGEYISSGEISEAFKITGVEPTGIFACQPFAASPTMEAMAKGALIAALFSIFAYFMISSNGRVVMSHNFGQKVFSEGEISQEFSVDQANSLYGIKVRTPYLNNAWSFFDVRVIDKAETEQLFTMPTGLSFYSGTEGGEYWSEGSTTVESYFRIPEPGEFKLAMDGEGGSGEQPEATFNMSSIMVEIRKGIRLGHFTLTWFFLCLLAAAPHFVRKSMFEASRWADEDEDDD
jgi:hypothetical protein